MANKYKAQIYEGKKLTSGEHERMLSHSVHDAKEAIKTASQITMDIEERKEDLDLPHPHVPRLHVPRHDGHIRDHR
jgi:hypothetical protein